MWGKDVADKILGLIGRMASLEKNVDNARAELIEMRQKHEKILAELAEMKTNYKNIQENVEKECKRVRESAEKDCNNLRDLLKNEIMAEIKAELAVTAYKLSEQVIPPRTRAAKKLPGGDGPPPRPL